MIKLKKDYPYSHNGIRLVEYKEGQETNELPDDIEAILIERGDACECNTKTADSAKTVIIESPKEPEENKLMEADENKEVKSPQKKKKK